MYLTDINHLAFITNDLIKTIRFYRDLLGMELSLGMGHGGFRHYFFKTGHNYIAFFAYNGAQPMRKKAHGAWTPEPLGFDHVSISVATKQDLFALKDRLTAAGVEVSEAVDHGVTWSIYFFDPNNIPLEASWDCLELIHTPAVEDDEPLDIVAEGAGPQPGVWPEVTHPTPPEQMTAQPGAGWSMRASFTRHGLARPTPESPV
jgi:catechol 2,3-dioxygenase-like lactoylglutathione lyase family enzyme